jgi:hypothetical protein
LPLLYNRTPLAEDRRNVPMGIQTPSKGLHSVDSDQLRPDLLSRQYSAQSNDSAIDFEYRTGQSNPDHSMYVRKAKHSEPRWVMLILPVFRIYHL